MKTTTRLAIALWLGAGLAACTPRSVSEGTATSSSSSSSTNSADRVPEFLPGAKIVYSANVNGEIEPCGCRGNPTGGIHRRWNLLRERVPGEKLSLDSGDLFYQSLPVPPFLAKQWNYQAETLARAYDALGIDVMTPGELDFAAGVEQFERLRARLKKIKIVSANIHRRDNGKLLLAPYVIVKKAGRKIAIFGVIDETLRLPNELEARDHVEAVRAMVNELRGKADLLIALTHIGLEKDLALARQVQGIDAIFGAHTQSFLIRPEKVGDTFVFQTSFRGQHLGVIDGTEHAMYQIDERFESAAGAPNPMDKLLAEAKAEIGKINAATEADLMGGPPPGQTPRAKAYQTFARCIECHAVQYDFHKKTPHFKAYETLIKADQASNLECLKCHTVGAQQPGGWSHVKKLVINNADKPVDAPSFVKSLPRLGPAELGKTSKAFINVQCETCHGPAGEHPFSNESMNKVSAATCLQCHTPERAPGWHKNGNPNQELIDAKIKSLACPRG